MKEWFLYRGKRYHKAGEIYNAGVIKYILLPEDVEKLNGNWAVMELIRDNDPELLSEVPIENKEDS